MLFDAAYCGWDIEASLTLELAPGSYGVETVEYTPDEDTALLLHRLTLRLLSHEIPRARWPTLTYFANTP